MRQRSTTYSFPNSWVAVQSCQGCSFGSNLYRVPDHNHMTQLRLKMFVKPIHHLRGTWNSHQHWLRFWSRSELVLDSQWRHSGGLRCCPVERWLWWLQAGQRASYSGTAGPGSAASLTDPKTCCMSAAGPWEPQDSPGTWRVTSPWRSGSHTTRGCHGDLGIQENWACFHHWNVCCRSQTGWRNGVDVMTGLCNLIQYCCHYRQFLPNIFSQWK